MPIEQVSGAIATTTYFQSDRVANKSFSDFDTYLPSLRPVTIPSFQLYTPGKTQVGDKESGEIPQIKSQIHEAEIELISAQACKADSQGREAFDQMLDLLAEAGFPINDIVAFRLTPSGQYQISGHGIDPDTPPPLVGLNFDPRVALPNQDLIEKIINGTAPEYAELSKNIKAKLNQMWGHFNNAHELRYKKFEMRGIDAPPYKSAYDSALGGGPIIFATDFAGHHKAGETRAYQNPSEFNDWKRSVGHNFLSLWTQEQIYARYFRDVAEPALLEGVTKRSRQISDQLRAESKETNQKDVETAQLDLIFYQNKLKEAEARQAESMVAEEK